VTQHATLTAERWARFSLDQQVLMIGNEMQRASSLMTPDDTDSRRRCYERVLRLVDLTVEIQTKRTLRRELLRWRDLIAELYVAPRGEPHLHREAFRALLQLRPVAARQIPLLLG
jgi:hypothetical protein